MILVCGRVCAGKTTYAKRLAREIGAVRLNADELMKPLFGEYLGNRHEEVLRQVTALLLEKATECYENGVNVITPELLIQLAALYQTSVDYLLGLTSVKDPYPRKS